MTRFRAYSLAATLFWISRLDITTELAKVLLLTGTLTDAMLPDVGSQESIKNLGLR